MGRPTLVVNADHVLVQFSGLDRVAGIVGTIMIPLSTIDRAEVGPPEWPRLREAWGMGLRAPRLVLKGRIGKPLGPFDRFYWQDRGTTRVLRLHLRGHPKLREVHLDVADPDGALVRIEQRRHAKRG
jgi:hypothetical protein